MTKSGYQYQQEWNRIKPRWDERARALLSVCGVPRGLLRDFSIDLSKSLVGAEIAAIDETKPPTILSVAKQKRVLYTLFDSKFTNPFVVGFNSSTNFLIARQMATVIFWQAIQQASRNAEIYRGQMPRWHYVAGGFDNVLVNEYQQGKHVAPLLLILDGLDTGMSSVKLEKTRDLLNVFCDRPRLLLISGDKPGEYVRDQLHIRLSGLVQFAAYSNGRRSVTI